MLWNFDSESNILDIEERSAKSRSNHAATNLYFYDNQMVEITTLGQINLEVGQLQVEIFNRSTWLQVSVTSY